jgi:hypothetical protein
LRLGGWRIEQYFVVGVVVVVVVVRAFVCSILFASVHFVVHVRQCVFLGEAVGWINSIVGVVGFGLLCLMIVSDHLDRSSIESK